MAALAAPKEVGVSVMSGQVRQVAAILRPVVRSVVPYDAPRVERAPLERPLVFGTGHA